MITLSVTDAARGFSDLINRIRYRGESVLLLKGGKPVAQVLPVKPICTGQELARACVAWSHLGEDEASEFESDLLESRATLGQIESKWD